MSVRTIPSHITIQKKQMKQYIIYKLWSDKAPDKVYIGQTKNTYYRWQRKQYRAKKIAAAIKEYGWTSFHHEVIAETDDKARANELELQFITQYNSVEDGLNSTYGTNFVGNAKRKRSSCRMQSKTMSKKVWYNDPLTGESFRFGPDETVPQGLVKGRSACPNCGRAKGFHCSAETKARMKRAQRKRRRRERSERQEQAVAQIA